MIIGQSNTREMPVCSSKHEGQAHTSCRFTSTDGISIKRRSATIQPCLAHSSKGGRCGGTKWLGSMRGLLSSSCAVSQCSPRKHAISGVVPSACCQSIRTITGSHTDTQHVKHAHNDCHYNQTSTINHCTNALQCASKTQH